MGKKVTVDGYDFIKSNPPRKEPRPNGRWYLIDLFGVYAFDDEATADHFLELDTKNFLEIMNDVNLFKQNRKEWKKQPKTSRADLYTRYVQRQDGYLFDVSELPCKELRSNGKWYVATPQYVTHFNEEDQADSYLLAITSRPYLEKIGVDEETIERYSKCLSEEERKRIETRKEQKALEAEIEKSSTSSSWLSSLEEKLKEDVRVEEWNANHPYNERIRTRSELRSDQLGKTGDSFFKFGCAILLLGAIIAGFLFLLGLI